VPRDVSGLWNRNGRWWVKQQVLGKRIRRSTGFRVGTQAAKQAALRRAAEIVREETHGFLGWKQAPTLKTYWLETYQPTYTTRKRAPRLDRQMMAHALPVLGPLRLDAVKKSDCEKYLNSRRRALTANPSWKVQRLVREGTVQRERSFLTAVFQQAVEDGWIQRNPWRGIERKPYAVRDHVLTAVEQQALLSRLSPRFQRFVLFLIGTGVRLEECRGIHPGTKAKDWANQDLHLTPADGDLPWVRVTGKFGKTREVPIPPELVPLIRLQLETEGRLWTQNPQRLREVIAEACQARVAIEGRTSRRGKAVAAREARVALTHVGPHTMRHTFGHRYLKGGGDIYVLSKILGHASVGVTEKHYGHLLSADIRKKARGIDLGLGLPPA